MARDIIRAAVSNVFAGYFASADLRQVTEWFDLGGSLQIDDTLPAAELLRRTCDVQGLHELTHHAGVKNPAKPPLVAAAVDFILEGLYAQKKITRSDEWHYQGAEPARRVPRNVAQETMIDREVPLAGQQEEVLQLKRTRPRLPLFQFTGEDLDDLDLEELLSKLSDLLLSSGFDYPSASLRRRPARALGRGAARCHPRGAAERRMLSDEMIEKLLGKDWQQADDAEERIERLVQQILDKLQRQGYLTSAPAPQSEMQDPSQAGQGGRGPEAPVRLRDHRQEPRLPRISRAARPARDRSARAASDATTRARWPPASRPAARRRSTSSATR